MSEVEAQGVPSEVAEAEVPAVATKPKERVKRPVRPDDEAYKQKVDALQETINKNKKRGDDIKQQLEDRRAGRTKGSSEQQGLKNKLAELRGQFQAVLKQKQNLREQLDAASKTREAVKASLKDLKANMKFTSVEQIDEAIAQLEHRVQHSSLTLNEEKRVLEDIRTLTKSRAAVGVYSGKLEVLAQDDSSRGELSSSLKSLDEELGSIRAQEDVLRAQLAALREKEAESGSDYPALLQEREECREVCKAAYEKIKDLRAAHDAVWQEFKDADKVWKVQAAADRALQQAEWAEERKRRDAERAARDAENAPEPFDKEITICEQLAAYLQRFQVSSNGAAGGQEAAAEVAEVQGMRVLKKAADEDGADAWLLGKGGKKGKGKGKKGGGGEKEAKAEKLVHSLDILSAFATLSLAVPTSAAAAPALLAEVAAKKEHFLKKRAEVKEKGAETTENDTGDKANGEAEAKEKEKSAEGAAAAKRAPRGGDKPRKAAPALQLDDAASWPSVGQAPGAPNGAAKALGGVGGDPGGAAAEQAAEVEVEEEQAPAEEAAEVAPVAAEAAAAVPVAAKAPAAAAKGGAVGVALSLSDSGEGVSLSITHSDE